MSAIEADIADIEASMDDEQPLSVVRGLDQLTALRQGAAAADARRVDLALCRWWHVLDEHETYRDLGAVLAADPEASVLERSWGRYWQAHARAHLVDGPEPAVKAYLPILDELATDLCAEATDLGNRLWNPMSRLWDDARFLAAYVPWAKPRFAQADEADQWEIVRRVRDHADSLADTEPLAAIGWFEELAGWDLLVDRPGPGRNAARAAHPRRSGPGRYRSAPGGGRRTAAVVRDCARGRRVAAGIQGVRARLTRAAAVGDRPRQR